MYQMVLYNIVCLFTQLQNLCETEFKQECTETQTSNS